MRPQLLAACLCLSPVVLQAETLHLAAPISAVTVYPQGAKLSRQATINVGPGHHRLVFSDLPEHIEAQYLRVAVTGARKGAMALRSEALPPARTFEHPEITAARDAVREAETAVQTARDRAAAARLTAQAAETRLQFLAGLGGTEGAANASQERLRALSELVGEEAFAARKSAHDAEILARTAEMDLPELEAALDQAQEVLRALVPGDTDRSVLSVEIEADQSGEVGVEISYFGNASWTPVYDIYLTRGANATLDVHRGALVHQYTDEVWRDVALTLSTLQPSGRIAPSQLYPWLRRAVDPAPPRPALQQADGMAEIVIESPVIVEMAESAAPITEGYALVYSYAHPVTILSGGEAMRIELGSLTTGAEIEARAVPQFDDTAFLVARMVNDTGQVLLPSDAASMFVDGDWVGVFEGFGGLTEGDEVELPFGPIRGLQLERTVLNRSEGDRGLITRSNAEVQTVQVDIRNLTGDTWPVRLMDRVPYAEQESVQIDWSAQPAPSEVDVEKRRGILAWDMVLAPGDAQQVQIDSTITWPEGKLLR